jgi:AcrR family transcriptional regulator
VTSSVEPTNDVRRVPRQQRAHESVQTILRAAAELIEESGYDAYNTNAVAERSGISVALIYRYFPNKESILMALWKEIQVDRYRYVLELLRQFPTVTDFDHFSRTTILLLRKVRTVQPGSRAMRKVVPAVPALAAIEHDVSLECLAALKRGLAERYPRMTEADAEVASTTLFSVVPGLVDATLDLVNPDIESEIIASNSRILALFFKDLQLRFQ